MELNFTIFISVIMVAVMSIAKLTVAIMINLKISFFGGVACVDGWTALLQSCNLQRDKKGKFWHTLGGVRGFDSPSPLKNNVTG